MGIFVFGSNLAGRHGKGAALTALQDHDAIYGCGEGEQGNAYAIPTKDAQLRPRPLEQIEFSVQRFKAWATAHPELRFYVTRIGCGLAGFKDSQIAPMFADAPFNCKLPKRWRKP